MSFGRIVAVSFVFQDNLGIREAEGDVQVGEDINYYLSISWLGRVILGCRPKPTSNGTFDNTMRHRVAGIKTMNLNKLINSTSSLRSLTLLQLTSLLSEMSLTDAAIHSGGGEEFVAELILAVVVVIGRTTEGLTRGCRRSRRVFNKIVTCNAVTRKRLLLFTSLDSSRVSVVMK